MSKEALLLIFSVDQDKKSTPDDMRNAHLEIGHFLLDIGYSLSFYNLPTYQNLHIPGSGSSRIKNCIAIW